MELELGIHVSDQRLNAGQFKYKLCQSRAVQILGSSNINFVNPAFLHTLHSALSLDNFVKRPIFQIGFAIVIYYVLK
jgi:hypothetical protein